MQWLLQDWNSPVCLQCIIYLQFEVNMKLPRMSIENMASLLISIVRFVIFLALYVHLTKSLVDYIGDWRSKSIYTISSTN